MTNDGPPRSRRTVLAAGAAGLGLGAVGVLDRARRSAADDAVPATESPAAGPERTEPPGPESTTTPDDAGGSPVIGANLNGRPHRLWDQPELVDASGTTWVRAFIDVREKLADGVAPANDPDVLTLRRLAREQGCRLAVSLKWDFRANWGDKPPARVPEPGSPAERELFSGAVTYLAAIGAPVDVLVLGNEPMWETPDGDLKVPDPPIVRFTRRAKAHLVEHGDHGEPTYLAGAFNRLQDDGVRTRHYADFYRGMLEFVAGDDDVVGVDLHLHFDDIAEAETALRRARADLPDATLTVTEFSPIYRYERYLRTPIDASRGGTRFAREHDLPAGMTPLQYFEDAKRHPRSAEELADFFAAMPWYNVDHLADMYRLFERFDVGLATFGFIQNVEMRAEDWTVSWQPFHINFLFQHALLDLEAGPETAVNRHYLEDYRRYAG